MRELRKLNSKDIYRVTAILSKIGINEIKTALSGKDVQKLVSSIDSKDSKEVQSIVGFNILMDVVGIIVANLDKAEKDINNFLASVTGMSTSDVEKMEMAEYMELIIEIVKKDEFKDFFRVASSLLR